MKRHIFGLTLLLLVSWLPSFAAGQTSRTEFTRLIAHWANYAGDDYLKFVEEAQPDICQVGFYGGHYWSLAHTPQYKGYPAHFPLQGLDECGKWHEQRNADVHRLGAKVVGHFNCKFLVGEPDGPEGPRGFFKFYRELWNEQELGPRPVEDPMDLLEKNAAGEPITNNSYSIGKMKEYWGCLLNPHWKTVLKAWAKRGIDRGVDGYIINYFYRHDCHCEHCQNGFREYLAQRYKADQLKEQFQIDDLKNHKFSEIVAWHKPQESTPLRREMLRFSQIANKQAYDEVFVKYGRSLKPDLILAQWNHLSQFSQISGDERCMLPAELWGKGEDYLWYSAGASGCYTDLKEGYLGEITLQARYVRGTFEDKPFTFGKYESTRIRTAIAELAANGGAPMGFYTRYEEPLARQEIVRYYQFLKRYDALYRANLPYSETALLYPRSQVHQGNVEAVESFKKLGNTLLNQHVLFDVIADDLLPGGMKDERLARYNQVWTYADAEKYQTAPATLSTFQAPTTVRVSASRPATGNELTLHFVNYNREEPAKPRSPGGGLKDEKPLAVSQVGVDFVLPADFQVGSVSFASPETPDESPVKYEVSSGRLKCEVPEFLVYGILRVQGK